MLSEDDITIDWILSVTVPSCPAFGLTCRQGTLSCVPDNPDIITYLRIDPFDNSVVIEYKYNGQNDDKLIPVDPSEQEKALLRHAAEKWTMEHENQTIKEYCKFDMECLGEAEARYSSERYHDYE